MAQLRGIRGVKIPVTDLGRSIDWYGRVFGFVVEWEFEDADGVVRGVAGPVSDGAAGLSLRLNPEKARALAGFDPVNWAVETRKDLGEWIEHLDALGVGHSPEIEASIGWLLVFTDPDGLEIHVYTDESHGVDHGDLPGYGRRVGMAG
ncbi:Glyoxalase/Bleomycin resistance protein/Dioxygenase superfamily protein [Lentzea waywayandensis]|uniref:Glyoxalase/Bleomycin resistance protein/Dioxygenase superfamily protein n=1 Tax=Lentzea waywayandensis TaxID=84724 RepID=A0A1I6FHN1_9PSEU|nr:VOC family protein [Lentzea waywayandensis]SFR29432.1 Glyoxalase/Bleomycin resistance protein/Dioxygenase superfamily protein [Lentzea waywayandensis]